MAEENPLLSIVITSYTTERLGDIFELLDSIKAQTYPNIETIFVAEKSMELSDHVKSYIEGKDIPNTKVVFNHGEPGVSAARNLGIEQAKGDIIAFVDDDALPFPDWAKEMVKTYEDESIIGVTGPAFPLWQDEPVAWLPEELYWVISCTAWGDWDKITVVRNVWFENASFRRESFGLAGYLNTKLGPQDSLGGFKQRELRKGIIGEDVELSLRVREKTGKQIVCNPKVKVWHKVNKERLRWRFITQWSYWLGSSKHKLKRLHPNEDKNSDVLAQEHQLLKRIFTKLLPNIAKGMFRDPIISWRKLWVTITVLFFVTVGYSFSSFRSLFARQPAVR